jgi:hypothetical protein
LYAVAQTPVSTIGVRHKRDRNRTHLM